MVFQVDVYTYDDARLRAIAVAKLSHDADIPVYDHCSAEVISQTEGDRVVMLTGIPSTVEAVINQLRQQQQLQDVVMSYIAV
jgi:hypothetical protein